MENNAQIQSALKMLEDAGYRCLAPCPKRESYETYGDTPPEPLFLGKVIDCETNGAHETAKIFEIGVVTFEYDSDGRIYRVGDSATMFEDIQEDLDPEISTITGRTNADIKGKRFDEERLKEFCLGTPGIIIAHNARFDRPKLERRFPWFQNTAWGCSLQDIRWLRQHGQVDNKLRLLVQDLCGMHFNGHQAEDDCWALLELLGAPLPQTEGTVFQQLLQNARIRATRIYAIDSPYEKKSLLNAAGFRWQGQNPKAYYRDVEGDPAEMRDWLQAEVYPYSLSENMLGYARVTAQNRYSTRIAPEPTYHRHTFPFGKHKGLLISVLAEREPDYLRWALENMDSLEPDLRRTIQAYLN